MNVKLIKKTRHGSKVIGLDFAKLSQAPAPAQLAGFS